MEFKYKINKQVLFIAIITFLALFIRLYRSENYLLGFDQIQILENAEKIKNGDLTLIGPRTGPAKMFTGPLIYYLCAFLMLFIPSPWTIVATAVSISSITGVVLYLVLRRYIKNENQQLAFFSLWALSPYIVYIDRIPWNPNFSFLSSILVFFPVIQILKSRQIKKIDFFLTSIGMFLAYQAHFSGFLLMPLIFLSYLFFFPKTKKSFLFLLISYFSITISFLPTLIFDLKNNFLNLRGFLEFSQNKIDPDKTVLLVRFLKNIYVTIEHFGKFLFLHNTQPLIIATGLIIISLYIIFSKRNKAIKSQGNAFLFIWIFFILFTYIFYRHSIPEYYYVIQFPPILYIISRLLSQLKASITILFILGLYFISINLSIYSDNRGLSIGNQIKLNQDIRNLSNKISIKEIVYDMELADDVSMRFLNQNLSLDDQGEIVHIIYPYQGGNFKTVSYGNLAFWIDTRNNPKLKYVSTDTYIIASPQGIDLFRDYYNSEYQTQDVYKLFSNSKEIGTLIIYLRQNEGNKWKDLKTIYENTDKSELKQSWVFSKSKYDNQDIYLNNENGHILVFVPSNIENNSAIILRNLSFIFSQ